MFHLKMNHLPNHNHNRCYLEVLQLKIDFHGDNLNHLHNLAQQNQDNYRHLNQQDHYID